MTKRQKKLNQENFRCLQDGEKIEVAEGDYYKEQVDQSAPSWNYIIDGCNVIE